ncbi:MAG: transglycosylase domain-containing protein [Oscillospiraceae bacterium]|nr:transglycosylase domain-containing protein [Oscillospiraceae bacterium]
MRKFVKRLICLLLVVVTVLGVVSFPIIKSGYSLYKETITNTPVEVKVEQIRSGDTYAAYEEISPVFIDLLVRSEDRRFYSHSGFDIISFSRAIVANFFSRSYSQGGSTLTQQLAKNMYFSFEKQLERKVAELLVAFDLERMYTKEEILALYCSMAYFGNRCYGVKQAARFYYNTDVSQLDDIQSYQLVETLKAPSVYNPSVMNDKR